MIALKKTQSGRNSLWALIEYAWYPALLFIATRYLLKNLGTHGYGSWMFLNAIVASSSILNVGIVGAVIKVVSAEIGAGAGRDRIGDVTNSTLGIALLSGTVTALITLSVIFLGWREASTNNLELGITAAFAAALIFVEHVDAGFSSVLKGGEHFSETAKIEMLYRTVQITAVLLVSAASADLVNVYLVLLLVNILRALTKMLRLKTVYDLAWIRPSMSCFSALIPYAKWGWLHGLGGFLLAVVDRLIVGSMLGAEALAFYTLLLMFPQQVHSTTAAAVSVMFPRISSLLSSNRFQELKLLVRRINLITFAAAMAITSVLVLFSKQIFALWLGRVLPFEAMAVMAPLSIAFFVLCLDVAPHYTLLGLGQIRYVAALNLIAGILSVAVLILLLKTHGLFATAISKGVYGGVLLVQFYIAHRALRDLSRRQVL
jgi:O-antigen/teichoic acid export membrane protein